MLSLFDFDRLYRRKIRGAGDSAAVVRLQTSPLKAGKIRILTHLTVEDQDNAYTLLRIGVSNRGEIYYLDELDAPAAAELAVSRSDIILGDGDRFFADLTGTTDADVLIMVLSGWEMKRK